MELPDDFGQFKSEFARQIAMEEEKAKNLNIWLLKGQHGLKRGTSESVLGKARKKPLRQGTDINSSKLHGSVGSLPSLVLVDKLVDEEEQWVTADQFIDILDQKEKQISQVQCPEEVLQKDGITDVKRLEEENIILRKRLENEMEGRRSSGVSLLGLSKYQELQRDVAKLQAKICKMEQSSEDPSTTRRLVTFLETFKSQLPAMDCPNDEKYECVLDTTLSDRHRVDNYRPSIDTYRPSIDSYRPSIESFGRPSMGSYRAACHPSPYRDELFRPQPRRADSCVAQFSRVNAGTGRFDGVSDRAESFGPLFGSEDPSSFKYSKVEESDVDSEARHLITSRPARPLLPRSRVVMGAKTVRRARDRGGRKGEPCRAFSSSDLLGERRKTREESSSSAEEVLGERPPRSMNSTMKSRSKSVSTGLSFIEATEVMCGDSDGVTDASPSSYSSLEKEKVSKEELVDMKNKEKDESKVQKFFKRLRKFVTKETKNNHDKDQEEVKSTRKMTRSLSHRIGKSKNLPKRLKSFHCSSSPRLRKDFYLK